MLGVLLSQSQETQKIVRRASFDIGSGATKVQCSDYEYPMNNEEGKMINIIFSEERPVPFGADYLNSHHGHISEKMQLRGLQTLMELKEKAVNCGAVQFSAIATEVFRKAKNGEAYLDRVRSLGIEVVIVTQELEAELGHKTAMLNSDCLDLDNQICVWDSGGGSFQLSTYTDSFQTYMAPIGSSTCAAYLANIKQISLQEKITPNPVTKEECNQLIDLITSQLPSPIPEWLTDQSIILSICGKNSIFKVCCNVLDELSKGPTHMASSPLGVFRRDTAPESMTHIVTSFTLQKAEIALETCLNSTDEELCRFVNFQYSDGPKIVVPKLCLLVAVMRSLNIRYVSTVKCTGSCSGIITDERFWRHVAPPHSPSLHSLHSHSPSLHSHSSLPPPPSSSHLNHNSGNHSQSHNLTTQL